MQTHVYNNPEKYSKSNNLQFDFAMQVISKVEIDMKSNVLDIGCGDGSITSEIAKLAGSVVGTDISETMIDYANKKYCQQKNLNFLQMDAAKNTFKNKFNVITSFNCLHWVKDQGNALNGIAQAATDNAQIVLLFSHRKSNYHYALETVSSSLKWNVYFKEYTNPRLFFDCDQYQLLLKKSGLNVLSLSEKEMTYHFDSIAQLKDFLTSSMANIKQIPDNKKDEFINDYCKEFFKLINYQDSAKIPVSFWCLEVFSTKLCFEDKHSFTVEKKFQSRM